MWLCNLFKRNPFPKQVKKHWYCGSWYLYVKELRDQGLYDGTSLDDDCLESPAKGKVAFNHFRCGIRHEDKSYLIDGLIPAIRIGNRIGLYKITKGPYRTTAFYDGLPWDDGKCIDLQFAKSVPTGEEGGG